MKTTINSSIVKNRKTVKICTLLFAMLFMACTDDDDDSVKPGTGVTGNPEELITTVNLIFQNSTGTALDTFSFNDPDGEGGNAPTIDTLRLMKNFTYKVDAQFLDASNPNDIEDITAEIQMEDDEHLVCYEMTGITGLQINRTDSDGTYEVGLQSDWISDMNAASTNGTLRLTLKHQPSVKDGSCAPGDTDVEIDFPLVFL